MTNSLRILTAVAMLAGPALLAGCGSPETVTRTTTERTTTMLPPPVTSSTTVTTIQRTEPDYEPRMMRQ